MTVVQNVQKRPDQTPWAYAAVSVGIIGPGFTGSIDQISGVSKDLADGTGLVSFDLAPGLYYVWTGPDGQQTQFGPVPASGGPYELAELANSPAFAPPGETAATETALLTAKTDLQDQIDDLPTTDDLSWTARIAKQRARAGADRRATFPLSEVVVSVGSTIDASLTKAVGVDVTAQTNGTTVVMTSGQQAALRYDPACPEFQLQVAKVGSFGYGFVFFSPSKVAATSPAAPHQNGLVPADTHRLTNSPLWAVELYHAAGATAMGFQIWADGRPCQSRVVPGTALADYVQVDLTALGPGYHKISLRTSAGIGPEYIRPNYDIYAPEPDDGPSAYFPLDSYGAVVFDDAGTSSAGGMFEEALGAAIGDGIGIHKVHVDPVAGTNITTRTSSGVQSPNNNYQDRWPQLLRVDPDLVAILNGSADDDFASVATATQLAAWRTVFGQQRTQNAFTKFVWIDGAQPPGFGSIASKYLATRNALLGDATIQGIGVYYADLLTNPVLYGTGHLGATAGDGPADFWVGVDTFHGNAALYANLMRRIQAFLLMVLLDDPTSPDSIINTVVTL